jgi:hypothetical protein
METECKAKELIANVYPPDQVEENFTRLIEHKRINAYRTAETVLMILKELKNG